MSTIEQDWEKYLKHLLKRLPQIDQAGPFKDFIVDELKTCYYTSQSSACEVIAKGMATQESVMAIILSRTEELEAFTRSTEAKD